MQCEHFDTQADDIKLDEQMLARAEQAREQEQERAKLCAIAQARTQRQVQAMQVPLAEPQASVEKVPFNINVALLTYLSNTNIFQLFVNFTSENERNDFVAKVRKR